MALISVIVPVYKSEAYIHRCVDSILAQTFTDFELILVDDGSPDNCPSICDEYAQQDNRIKVIHQKNHGQAYARNVGIDMAMADDTCQYIAFIDSDDWVEKEYLETLMAGMTDDVAISVCQYVSTDGVKKYNANKETCCETKLLSGHEACYELVGEKINFIVPWAKIYSKAVFKSVRFPLLPKCEDEAIAHYIYYSCKKIFLLPHELYYYYINPDSVMNGRPFSLRDWQALSAFQERISFFEEKGEQKLVLLAKRQYIRRLAEVYDMGLLAKSNKEVFQTIKREFYSFFDNNKKIFPLLDFKKEWFDRYRLFRPALFFVFVFCYCKRYGLQKMVLRLFKIGNGKLKG